MADPKNPENTRPFTPRPNPLTDKTIPIATGGSEVTRPTVSVTRPTAVTPKETTRPVAPVGKTPTSSRTPVVKSPTATRTPVLRRSGTTSRESQTNPAMRPELLTDGMRARRREVERKKRRAVLERMRLDAELSEGWRRVWKTTGLVVLVLSLFYGYWRVQQAYGDRWPLMLVWLTMAFFILTGFGWILWYMNKGDV
jgi:hypothetical protein